MAEQAVERLVDTAHATAETVAEGGAATAAFAPELFFELLHLRVSTPVGWAPLAVLLALLVSIAARHHTVFRPAPKPLLVGGGSLILLSALMPAIVTASVLLLAVFGPAPDAALILTFLGGLFPLIAPWLELIAIGALMALVGHSGWFRAEQPRHAVLAARRELPMSRGELVDPPACGYRSRNHPLAHRRPP